MITAMTHPRIERAPQTMRESHVGTGVLSPVETPSSDDIVTALANAEKPAEVAEELQIFNVQLQGVGFRSTAPLQPGTLRHLRTNSGDARLTSKVRIISCRLRGDGFFDITAEFF
jgi:hypothetical protein